MHKEMLSAEPVMVGVLKKTTEKSSSIRRTQKTEKVIFISNILI